MIGCHGEKHYRSRCRWAWARGCAVTVANRQEINATWINTWCRDTFVQDPTSLYSDAGSIRRDAPQIGVDLSCHREHDLAAGSCGLQPIDVLRWCWTRSSPSSSCQDGNLDIRIKVLNLLSGSCGIILSWQKVVIPDFPLPLSPTAVEAWRLIFEGSDLGAGLPCTLENLAATEVRRLLRTHPERATDMPDDKLRPLLQGTLAKWMDTVRLDWTRASFRNSSWQCSCIFGICSLNLRPARHWKNDSWPVWPVSVNKLVTGVK